MMGLTLRNRASATALALALVTGAIVTAAAIGFADPAYAQRGKSPYSKEFVAKYQPLSEALKKEGVDINALKPQLLELIAAAGNPAEQLAAGGLVYDAAAKVSDYTLQLTGMETLLASGQVEAEKAGQYNYIAYQLANNTNQQAKARASLRKVMELGYMPQGLTSAQLDVLISESYFAENMLKEGLQALGKAIKLQKERGQPVDERWYRRGLSIAYNNKIRPEIYDFVIGWVGDNPSEQNWRDAINLVRNIDAPADPEALDLLRLAARLGTINDKSDVIAYVEFADVRRAPFEVKALIEAAYDEGTASKDDIFLADALASANQRLADDRASLPDLAAEADATSSDTKIVMGVADAYFSYGEYDKAEAYYTKALDMPGAETPLVLMRLGMSQIEQRKLGEARATLAKVDGARMPIARLWLAYVDDLEDGSAINGV
jgi:tetratricopeptide (TPR) repeat protein